MRLEINFIGTATIDNINLRKKSGDDDRVIAIDIKLSGQVTANVLNHLLIAEEGADLSQMFWNPSYEPQPAELIALGMDNIPVDREWESRLITLGKTTVRAHIKKPSFKPRSGKIIDLSFTASIDAPEETFLNYLIQRMKEDIRCKVESDPEMDLQQKATG